jgi:hypothetical protein
MKKLVLVGSMIAAFIILNTAVSHAQVTYTTPGVAPAGASSGTAAPTASVSAQIGTVLDLAVTDGGSVPFDFSGGIAALETGIEKDGAVTLTFRSNLPWYVNVAANSDNFSYTGADASAPSMPSSILQYRLGGGANFTGVTTSQQSVVGTSGTKQARGAGAVVLDYKMNPGYIYSPGSYGLTVTYTISNL